MLYPLRSKMHPYANVNGNRFKLKVDLRDAVIARMLYIDGEYEPEFHDLMSRMGLEGSICVDIGANIGLHSLALSRFVGSGGKVFSFEPSSHNFALLKENLRLNDASNVSATNAAVGSRAAKLKLQLSSTNFGDHKIAVNGKAGGACEEVDVIAIDQALADVPAGKIKCIKVDVQGFEHEVILGMRKTLEKNPDAFVFLEVGSGLLEAAGSSGRALMKLMRELGFAGWEIHPIRVMPVSEPWAYDLIDHSKDVNVLFCKNEAKLIRLLEEWKGLKIVKE